MKKSENSCSLFAMIYFLLLNSSDWEQKKKIDGYIDFIGRGMWKYRSSMNIVDEILKIK
jgi:hypothetical protein